MKVILHELPVHPEVHAVMQEQGDFRKGNEAFLHYVDTLKPAPAIRILTPDPATCGLASSHTGRPHPLRRTGREDLFALPRGER